VVVDVYSCRTCAFAGDTAAVEGLICRGRVLSADWPKI
jgi:hypothetical protein